MAKPLRCRLRLHTGSIARTPIRTSTTKSVCAVTRIETEGTQPLTVEEPGVSGVEGILAGTYPTPARWLGPRFVRLWPQLGGRETFPRERWARSGQRWHYLVYSTTRRTTLPC